MVVTVQGTWNDDLPAETLKSILRKAELNESWDDLPLSLKRPNRIGLLMFRTCRVASRRDRLCKRPSTIFAKPLNCTSKRCWKSGNQFRFPPATLISSSWKQWPEPQKSLLSGGQTPFQIFLRDSLNLYDLEAACQAHHDAHPRTRHSGELREEPHALVIGLAVHRRGGQRQLPGVAQAACQGGAPGARMHLYRETRHATLALKFATPAATRVSTTSKAMVSSSQSWLEPSASCVATVSVYCCGVSQQASWKSTSSSSPASRSPRGIFSIRVLVP